MSGRTFCITPLMKWEKGILAALIGAFGCRYPAAACAVLAGYALSEAVTKADLKGAVRAGLALFLCAAAGFCWCRFNEPAPPDEPVWADPGAYRLIRGTVGEVRGLQDRRWRVLLQDADCYVKDGIPIEKKEGLNGAVLSGDPLEGLLSVTWEEREKPPVTGQILTVRTKVRPVYGEQGKYWAARDVWHTGWLSGENNLISLEGEGSFWGRLRAEAEDRLIDALSGFSPEMSGDVSGVAEAASVQGAKMGKAAGKRMPQGLAAIPALIFGDRYYLDTASIDLFTRGSIVHSLSLSGQHLALCGLIAAALVWLAGRLRPQIFLTVPRKKLLFLLALPCGALYLWLGGFPLSLTRAFLMTAAGGILWSRARTAVLADLLFYAALLFFLFWPACVFDLSVQLSFISVAAIAAASPLIGEAKNRLFQGGEGGLLRSVAEKGFVLLGISLAIQIVTLPVLIYTFGTVSPCFPLNLIWLPVLETIVLPLAAAGTAAVQLGDGGAFLLYAASLPADAMLALLEKLDGIGLLTSLQALRPLSVSAAGYVLLLAGAAAFASGIGAAWRKERLSVKRGGVLIAFGSVLLLLSPALREYEQATSRGVRVSLIDVGQGQSVLLETEKGRVLIDAGGIRSPRFDPGRDLVAPYLTENRPPVLAAAAVTHDDTDHAKGMLAILEAFDVPVFMRSEYVPAEAKPLRVKLDELLIKRGIKAAGVGAGDVFDLGGGFELEVLHPDRGVSAAPSAQDKKKGKTKQNEASLVLRLTKDGRGLVLICGDIEKSAIKRLVKSGMDLSAEILILPHHGSKSSLSEALYAAAGPKEAWVSCGRYNSYGFPSGAVKDSLKKMGIPLRSTAEEGGLVCKWD